ncbi:MAG: aminotransferase class III-fold pyridoxal phosphate-dependent enzyme [Thaumarchaeota archaeon]|nr:aminotransferase class III-fold pyridoxal phosphate-dependent enzyme [Nitrososphaerota archaeon]
MRMLNTFQRYGIKVVRGEGVYVWDDKGKKYLDFMQGFGVGILGHKNQAVIQAIYDQLNSLDICHGSLYNDARERFLEEFFKIAPKSLSKAFLSNSGAESVELALKLARKYTGKKGFISFTGAYHGKTFGALSVTYSEKYKEGFGPLLEPVRFLKYGDVEAINSADFNDIAGVIVEPIQGEAGIIIPPDDFLPTLREVTEKKGVLLIIDEIQSGMGRTGKWWAHQHWNIEPDIMTAGKGIGGGIPMGVTAVKEEIASVIKVGEHSSTMGGNPIASAAGAATIKEVRKLIDDIPTKGEMFVKGLKNIQSKAVKDVRGKGLMIALDLRFRFKDVLFAQLNNGLISLYSGLTVLRYLPPYIISYKDINDAIAIIEKSLMEIDSKRFV